MSKNANNTGNMKYGRINPERFNPWKLHFAVLLLKWINTATNFFFFEKGASLESIIPKFSKIQRPQVGNRKSVWALNIINLVIISYLEYRNLTY